MGRVLFTIFVVLFSNKVLAWGYMGGSVEVLHTNTYGNYAEGFLDGGFCFKLKGQSSYLKIGYADAGEKRKNFDFVQGMVLAAHMSGKELNATFVDWGTDPTCRVSGTTQPAKWLEDLSFKN